MISAGFPAVSVVDMLIPQPGSHDHRSRDQTAGWPRMLTAAVVAADRTNSPPAR